MKPILEPSGSARNSRENMTEFERFANLLDDLPDCQKMKLADMDLITRSNAPTTEMATSQVEESLEDWGDSFEYWEEMTACAESDDHETKTLKTVKELDKILQRIEILQGLIRKQQRMYGSDKENKPETETGTEKEPVSCEEGLSEDQVMIRCLRKTQHRLQCEIDELVCCYGNMRNILQEIGRKLANVQCQIHKMRNLNKINQEWMVETGDDLVDCQMRHQGLATEKLTKQMAYLVSKNNMACGLRFSRRFLQKSLLRRHLNDFHYEIDELKQFALDMGTEIDRRLANIRAKAADYQGIRDAKSLSICSKRVSSCKEKISGEKKINIKGY